ncbi:nucleotide-binding universal stress UspA family protein [Murinocardiopsis flavida]|uniref:Nucleotide-binding universal stress UspA family protein n=1 Tax=Murinocardiopsis flavida TaxID=645275 RepID=A0A2P8D195_9ACTN|nr:universal stress protein [Murinocardiopsis flavida]PSK90946.1 nucleotide-binding universal stress UspA family protein [Murinocardiopsis flavida]
MVDNTAAPSKVLVGVDGSSPAQEALIWATAQAGRRNVPLVVVYALSVPLAQLENTGVFRLAPSDTAVAHAEHVLAEAAEHARTQRFTGPVETLLALEKPAVALMRQSTPADLVVVGSRGLGALGTAFLGSTSVRLVAQATCPVIVVHGTRGRAPSTEPRRTVVGVDGSECSQRALVFALEQGAGTADASLVVVNSMEAPTPFAAQSLVSMGGPAPDRLPEHLSKDLVADMIAEAGEATTHAIDITVLCTRADPVEALLAEGAKADLVVLGSRGRGGVRGLFLGSVSQRVLRSASVPVAIVPHGVRGVGTVGKD